MIEALTAIWLLVYVINENVFRREWKLFQEESEKWDPCNPDREGDMKYAIGELIVSIKRAMKRNDKTTASDLSGGPQPSNVGLRQEVVSSIDLTQNLKRHRIDNLISPMAEQFMSHLSEAAAATCFQCTGENVTVVGHD